MDILQEINNMGTTVVVSTHNLEIVKKINKRVIQLENGYLKNDTKSLTYTSLI